MKLTDFKNTAEGYKGWFLLAFGAYLLFTFRGLFSALGGAVSTAAEAATGGVIDAAQGAVDRQKVKAAAGVVVPPTDAQIAVWKADATSLAHMLGHDSFGVATVFKDRASAFTLLKRTYSRLTLLNNHPVTAVIKGKNTVMTPQTHETPQSAKRPVNWRVLAPFYKDATNGRDLLADLRSDLDNYYYRPYITWII